MPGSDGSAGTTGGVVAATATLLLVFCCGGKASEAVCKHRRRGLQMTRSTSVLPIAARETAESSEQSEMLAAFLGGSEVGR